MMLRGGSKSEEVVAVMLAMLDEAEILRDYSEWKGRQIVCAIYLRESWNGQ